MFWNREKTVKVVVLNQQLRLDVEQPLRVKVELPEIAPIQAPALPTQQGAPALSDHTSESNSQAVVIMVKAAGVIQLLLLIFGYTFLAGHYDQYGIQMDELEVSTPALLLQGYFYVITEVLMPLGPDWGGLLLCGSIILVSSGLTLLLFSHKSPEWQFKCACLTILASMIMFFVPACGVRKGIDETKHTLASDGIHPSASNELTHILDIPGRGKTSGPVIAATPRYTFMLIDKEVLKIANDSREVVRVIQLEAATPSK